MSEPLKFKKRRPLLGNGFSIACRPDIFTYASLFEKANFSSASKLDDVFSAFKTEDVEPVIKSLEGASRLASIYSTEPVAMRMADVRKL